MITTVQRFEALKASHMGSRTPRQPGSSRESATGEEEPSPDELEPLMKGAWIGKPTAGNAKHRCGLQSGSAVSSTTYGQCTQPGSSRNSATGEKELSSDELELLIGAWIGQPTAGNAKHRWSLLSGSAAAQCVSLLLERKPLLS